MCSRKHRRYCMHHLVTEKKIMCSKCVLKQTFLCLLTVRYYRTEVRYGSLDKALASDQTQIRE